MHNLDEYLNKLRLHLQQNKSLDDKKLEDIMAVFVAREINSGTRHKHILLPERTDKNDLIEFLIDKAKFRERHAKLDFDSVFFKSRLAFGDALVMTCAVRDFKKCYPNIKIGVRSTAPHIWDNNPYIDSSITEENADKVVNCGTGYLTNKSNTLNLHMCNAYRISIQNELGIEFGQGPIRPDVWLSIEEFNKGRVIDDPYWVICIGGESGWTAKMWPFEYWQNLVDNMADILPNVKFVQIGMTEHERLHGTLKNNRGNLYNIVGKTQDKDTGIRNLFRLFLHAEGSIGLVSMHMHLSAAFGNPCVVIGQGREPSWFTHYYGHQFISTNGVLNCSRERACWACDVDGKRCVNHAGKDSLNRTVPMCSKIITPRMVEDSLLQYYNGGVLDTEKPKPITFKNVADFAKPKKIEKEVIEVSEPKKATAKVLKPKLRMLTTCRGFGGSERSSIKIMDMFIKHGWDVDLVPFGGKTCDAYKKALNKNVTIDSDPFKPCNIFFYYTSDSIYHEQFERVCNDIIEKVPANKKMICLNYRLGKFGKFESSKKFDKYFFLCSQKADELARFVQDSNRIVLAPPIDISKLCSSPINTKNVNMNNPLHIVRHSSQGDSKWPKDINDLIKRIWDEVDDRITFEFMPAPSFMINDERIIKHKVNEIGVDKLLLNGDIFIYPLPNGYQDQGPRVIMEAMLLGLPVIADNSYGARDRVTDGCTGYLCSNYDDYINYISYLNENRNVLYNTSTNSSSYAKENFDSELWFQEIVK